MMLHPKGGAMEGLCWWARRARATEDLSQSEVVSCSRRKQQHSASWSKAVAVWCTRNVVPAWTDRGRRNSSGCAGALSRAPSALGPRWFY